MIRISKKTFETLSPSQLDEYLEGSGMPKGYSWNATAGVSDVVITWVIAAPAANDAAPVLAIEDMTKEQLEQFALDNFQVNLNTKQKKADLYKQVMELING